MVWVKYRHKEAAGPGPWEWEHWPAYSKEIAEQEEERELIEDNLVSRYEYEGGYIYEDRYRGVEIEFHEEPPKEVVQNRLRYLYSKRDSIESQIRQLEKQYKE